MADRERGHPKRRGGEDIAHGDLMPFVCECADPNCRDLVRMSLDEYRMMRADPRLFVNAPSREAPAHGWAKVVARRDGHVFVEDIGEAGVIATELEGATLLPPQRQSA